MKNKDMMAFPFFEPNSGFGRLSHGLSKREYFAGLALQGYIAMFSNTSKDPNPAIAASKCVAYADALLAELSNPQP